MSTTTTGRQAEAVAAAFLESRGCKVLQQNWRTRWCEIDIVAQRKKVVYLCEVKYRQTNRQGSGLEYITPKKLKQMQFAAEFWVQTKEWQGDYQLCAIEVSGNDFRLTNVITDITL